MSELRFYLITYTYLPLLLHPSFLFSYDYSHSTVHILELEVLHGALDPETHGNGPPKKASRNRELAHQKWRKRIPNSTIDTRFRDSIEPLNSIPYR